MIFDLLRDEDNNPNYDPKDEEIIDINYDPAIVFILAY